MWYTSCPFVPLCNATAICNCFTGQCEASCQFCNATVSCNDPPPCYSLPASCDPFGMVVVATIHDIQENVFILYFLMEVLAMIPIFVQSVTLVMLVSALVVPT